MYEKGNGRRCSSQDVISVVVQVVGRQEEGFRPLRPQPVHVQSSDLFWWVMGQLFYVIVLHGPIVNDEFILPMHLQLA